MTYIGKLIGNTLFKTTGLMSSKTAMRKSGEIGTEVLAFVRESGSVQPTEFQSIMKKVLGKRADKIDLVLDKETTITELQSRLRLTREEAQSYYNTSGSLVLGPDSEKNTFLNLRLDRCNAAELVNLSAHESEHALMEAYSLSTKVSKLLRRLPFFDKKIEHFLVKYAPMLNAKSEKAQMFILQSPETLPIVGLSKIQNTVEGFMSRYAPKGEGELRERIRSILYGTGILKRGDDRKNYIVASALHSCFKDEVRAYAVGGKAERELYESMGKDLTGRATSSDLRSRFYNEFCKIFEEEARSNLKNWFKSKLGLKVDRSYQDECIKNLKKSIKEKAVEKQLKEEELFWRHVTNNSI